MNDTLKQIGATGIVPVVVLNKVSDAEPLAESLIKGGLPCAEVTFRTDAAEESIRAIAKKFPDMFVGAGTVLTTEQVDRAIGAGAKCIVSPGLNPKVVEYCIKKGYPITPGIMTPTELEVALGFGLDVVKFFPAENAGGLKMIKAMAAPYTQMKFMPTGGINEKNICEYLAFDKIIACGGSWMVSKDLVKAGEFDKIAELTEEAVRTMLGFSLKHVGINCKDVEESKSVTACFDNYFGFEQKVGNSSVFAGTLIEAMNGCGRGTKGHIAIGTNSVQRAANYLATVKGVEFIEETKSYKGDKLNLVYLKDEIGGFAVHLVNK